MQFNWRDTDEVDVEFDEAAVADGAALIVLRKTALDLEGAKDVFDTFEILR